MDKNERRTSSPGTIIVNGEAVDVTGFLTHTSEQHTKASKFHHGLFWMLVELCGQSNCTPSGSKGKQSWQNGRLLAWRRHTKILVIRLFSIRFYDKHITFWTLLEKEVYLLNDVSRDTSFS